MRIGHQPMAFSGSFAIGLLSCSLMKCISCVSVTGKLSNSVITHSIKGHSCC